MTNTFATRIASSLFTALSQIAAANAAYRETHKLQHLTDDHLADMGLTRQDAEALLDSPQRASKAPNRASAVQLRRV